jgi:hypothetical protein
MGALFTGSRSVVHLALAGDGGLLRWCPRARPSPCCTRLSMMRVRRTCCSSHTRRRWRDRPSRCLHGLPCLRAPHCRPCRHHPPAHVGEQPRAAQAARASRPPSPPIPPTPPLPPAPAFTEECSNWTCPLTRSSPNGGATATPPGPPRPPQPPAPPPPPLRPDSRQTEPGAEAPPRPAPARSHGARAARLRGERDPGVTLQRAEAVAAAGRPTPPTPPSWPLPPLPAHRPLAQVVVPGPRGASWALPGVPAVPGSPLSLGLLAPPRPPTRVRSLQRMRPPSPPGMAVVVPLLLPMAPGCPPGLAGVAPGAVPLCPRHRSPRSPSRGAGGCHGSPPPACQWRACPG